MHVNCERVHARYQRGLPDYVPRRLVIAMRSRGFTLMEMLVVIVVVGILAAIALPSYQGYIKKSRAQTAG